MSHPDQGLLHALLDGEAPAAEAARIQAHLEQCPTCRQELEQAREFRAEALALVEALDAEPVAASMGSAPRATPVPRRPRRRLPWTQTLAWAASLALAASAGYFAASWFPRPPIELSPSPGPAASLEGAADDELRERQPEPGAAAIATRPATATPRRAPSAAQRSEGRPRDADAEPATAARAEDLAPAPPVPAREPAVEEPARRAQAEPQDRKSVV